MRFAKDDDDQCCNFCVITANDDRNFRQLTRFEPTVAVAAVAFTDLFSVCGVFKFARPPDCDDFKTEFLHNDFETLQFDSYLANWYMIGPIGVL